MMKIFAYTRHAPASIGTPEEWFLVLINFSDGFRPLRWRLIWHTRAHSRQSIALSGGKWPEIPLGEPYRVDLPPMSGIVLQLTLK